MPTAPTPMAEQGEHAARIQQTLGELTLNAEWRVNTCKDLVAENATAGRNAEGVLHFVEDLARAEVRLHIWWQAREHGMFHAIRYGTQAIHDLAHNRANFLGAIKARTEPDPLAMAKIAEYATMVEVLAYYQQHAMVPSDPVWRSRGGNPKGPTPLWENRPHGGA